MVHASHTQVEDDPTGGKLASSMSMLNGAPHKLSTIINFHVGDTVTSLQRCALQPGGQEVRNSCEAARPALNPKL
eukprot:228953-Chlamydomonas_euryale.AAC.2